MATTLEKLPGKAEKPTLTKGTAGQFIAAPTMTAEQQGFLKDIFGYLKQNLFAPIYDQQQKGAFKSALGRGMDLLQPAKRFDFAPIEAQAQRQFEEQIVPTLAERFTALGGEGRSSSFPQLLGQAGAGLAENLAALKGQIGLQQYGQDVALGQFLTQLGLQPNQEKQFAGSLLGSAYQAPYQAAYQPPQQSGLGQFGTAVGTGLGYATPFLVKQGLSYLFPPAAPALQ